MINTKLEKLQQEYNQITSELSNPQVFCDSQKLQELSKRQIFISNLISKYQELKKIIQEIESAKSLKEKETEPELLKLAEDEIKKLEEQKIKLENQINQIENKTSSDFNDEKNVIVEIRAGTGGNEAALFAADLFRMYARYGQRRGWQTKLVDLSPTDLGGFKEVIFEVNGQGVYGELKNESGVHRVQRIPQTEKSGRIHTSTATVAILPQAEEVDIKIKPEDLRIDTFRAGGPGGQKVNKTDSAVRITHLPTGIVVKCQDEKSQLKNRQKALRVLRSRIFATQLEKKLLKEQSLRRGQIGSAQRAEKIKTYNFPQDRLTDHRIKKSWHNLEKIMEGELDEIISSFKEIKK